MRPGALLVAAGLALAGCGSEAAGDLPAPGRLPPSPPQRDPVAGRVELRPATVVAPRSPMLLDGRVRAVLRPRARELVLQDAASGATLSHAAAGVGPTHVACQLRGPCYVTDTAGNALLVMRVTRGGRGLSLTRRLYLPGGPYAIAANPGRNRLWVTLLATNELIELPAHLRPHVLQRLDAVRRPATVGIDPATRDVVVGSGRREQVFSASALGFAG